jgi:hypothetical protein
MHAVAPHTALDAAHRSACKLRAGNKSHRAVAAARGTRSSPRQRNAPQIHHRNRSNAGAGVAEQAGSVRRHKRRVRTHAHADARRDRAGRARVGSGGAGARGTAASGYIRSCGRGTAVDTHATRDKHRRGRHARRPVVSKRGPEEMVAEGRD